MLGASQLWTTERFVVVLAPDGADSSSNSLSAMALDFLAFI